MRFAMCNELFENWNFDRVCRFLKQSGYEGVEVAPFTLAPRSPTSRASDGRAARTGR